MNEASNADRKAGPVQGLTLAVQGALPAMGAMLLAPVVPQMLAEFAAVPGADYLVPALVTIPGVFIALLALPSGLLGDRIGLRWPLIIALIVYAIAGAAPMVAQNFTQIFASRMALGACEAVIITLSTAMIADHFIGRTRERWIASTTAIASISAIVFVGVAGAIASQYGWRSVTLVYLSALIIAPAMLFFTWDKPRAARRSADATPVATEPFPWRTCGLIVVAALFGSTLFYSGVVHMSRPLTELGVTDPKEIGGVIAIASLGVPLGTLAFSLLSRLGVAWLVAIACLLVGGGFIGLSQAGAVQAFMASAFISLLGAGILLPTLLNWSVQSMPFVYRGRGVGVFQSVFALGQFVSGILITFVALNLLPGFMAAYGAIGVAAAGVGGLLALTTLVRRAVAGKPAARTQAP